MIDLSLKYRSFFGSSVMLHLHELVDGVFLFYFNFLGLEVSLTVELKHFFVDELIILFPIHVVTLCNISLINHRLCTCILEH